MRASRALAIQSIEFLENRITPVTGLDSIGTNLSTLLTSYQGQILDGEIDKVNLPLIGAALQAKPLQFAQTIATNVTSQFGAINNSQPILPQVRSALVKAFQVNDSDLAIVNQDGMAVKTQADADAATSVEFLITKTVSLDPVTTKFDLGSALGNIGFKAPSADVNLSVSYTLPLKFGIDGGKNASDFFVDVSGDSNLTVTAKASPATQTINGNLGLLAITATNQNSQLTATFTADVAGNLLRSNLATVTATTRLAGNLSLHLQVSAAANLPIAPNITTTLNVDWNLTDTDANSGLLGDAAPTVQFANVSIDVGSVARNLIAPYLNEVEKVVQPVQQLANFLLARPVPQIPLDYLSLFEFASKLDSKDDTIATLLKAFQQSPSDLRLFLEKVKAIGDLLNFAKSSSGGMISLGDLTPSDVRSTAIALPTGMVTDRTDAPQFAQLKAGLDSFAVTTATFQAKLNVDLISNTTNVFKLLLGKPDAQLLSFTLHTSTAIQGNYQFTTLVGIVPVQFALVGGLNLAATFQLGYDAAGLVKYQASGQAADLDKGFYIGPETALNFTPFVNLTVTGGYTKSTILGLIKSYTGVSVPGWVLDLSGFEPTLAVSGHLNADLNVQFSVANPTHSTAPIHLDQFPGGNIASAIVTKGDLGIDASAQFIYGIHAELPGRKVFNRLGLGKIVGGAKFDVGGSLDLFKYQPPRIPLFPTSSANANLQSAPPTPPVVTINVDGAVSTKNPNDPSEWIIAEGNTAGLRATASTPSNPDRFSYAWKQLTPTDLKGFVYQTPAVKLSDPNVKAPTFVPIRYSTKGNLDYDQDLINSLLVGLEDRYRFEVTVTDLDTGLSTKQEVAVVAQDVTPTVAVPTANINNVATPGNIGVRGFNLNFNSTFADPGNSERFDDTWDFGDPTGANNVIKQPSITDIDPNATSQVQDRYIQEGIRPGRVGASHTFTVAKKYTVGLTVSDGFTANSISKTRGTRLVQATADIRPAYVLPDQADANKMALYVGGTDDSETIVLGWDAATQKITVTMPGFFDEFQADVAHIYVNGQGGDDTILFDFTAKNFVPGSYQRTEQQLGADGMLHPITYTDSGGAIVDGGTGTNRYQAIGGSFDSVAAAFLPDNAGVFQNGYVNYVQGGGLPDALVNFLHVQSVYELSGAKELSIAGNPDADQFLIRDGVTVGTTATTEVLDGPSGGRGSFTFANKPLVTIASGAGADTFTVDNPNPAAGLTDLVLDGHGIPARNAAGDDLPDDNAADTFLIRNIGVDVSAFGEGGDDTFIVSSTAGIDDRGNVDGIKGNLTIDAGSGSNNRLSVIDYGSLTGNPNIVVTGSTITGLAPGTITYLATGGSFLPTASGTGIMIVGSFTMPDRFNIQSIVAGTQTMIMGLGGDDVFYVSSGALGSGGNLNGIVGDLVLDGGLGAYADGTPESNLRGLISLDQVIVEADANYTLADTTTTLADGTNTPDQTASGAILQAQQAGIASSIVPDIRLISIESARLIGGASANRMDASGFSGAVELDGLGGNDTLIGGSGDTILDGGDGDDDLFAGTDRFLTPGLGSQANVVLGGGGASLLLGGAGDDTFHADLGSSATLIGGAGNDTFLITNPTTGGLTAPVAGITVDGGGQAGDTLNLIGGGGSTDNQTYVAGPAAGSGQIVTTNNHNPTGPTISQFVRFTGLATINDTITANRLDVLAASADAPLAGASTADLTIGLIRLTIGGSAFPTIHFANKATASVLLADGRTVTTLSTTVAPPVALAEPPLAAVPVVQADVVGPTGSSAVAAMAPPAATTTKASAPVAAATSFAGVGVLTTSTAGTVAHRAITTTKAGSRVRKHAKATHQVQPHLATPHPKGPTTAKATRAAAHTKAQPARPRR